jgi:predicted outer membrane protein
MARDAAGAYLRAMQEHNQPSLFLRAAGASLLLAAITALAQSDPVTPVQPPPGGPTSPTPGQPGLPENGVVTPTPPEDLRFPNATQTDGESTSFINKVSMLTDESVRISQVATQRAATQEVKTFADQVQQSTQAIQSELGNLAQTRNILIPTGREGGAFGGDDDGDGKWAKKDAKEFDVDYVKRVVKLHKDAIEELEDYAKDGSADPELASFAQKHIPILREQLRQAESLEDQID